MNQFNGIGNLVRDVELKKTQTGKSVANFTLAINKGRDEVDYLDFVAWERVAEVLAKYTTKGTKIGVTGSVQKRSYENKEGNKVYITEIVAHQVHLIDTRKQEPVHEPEPQYEAEEEFGGPTLDISSDDLPF